MKSILSAVVLYAILRDPDAPDPANSGGSIPAQADDSAAKQAEIDAETATVAEGEAELTKARADRDAFKAQVANLQAAVTTVSSKSNSALQPHVRALQAEINRFNAMLDTPIGEAASTPAASSTVPNVPSTPPSPSASTVGGTLTPSETTTAVPNTNNTAAPVSAPAPVVQTNPANPNNLPPVADKTVTADAATVASNLNDPTAQAPAPGATDSNATATAAASVNPPAQTEPNASTDAAASNPPANDNVVAPGQSQPGAQIVDPSAPADNGNA